MSGETDLKKKKREKEGEKILKIISKAQCTRVFSSVKKTETYCILWIMLGAKVIHGFERNTSVQKILLKGKHFLISRTIILYLRDLRKCWNTNSLWWNKHAFSVSREKYKDYSIFKILS